MEREDVGVYQKDQITIKGGTGKMCTIDELGNMVRDYLELDGEIKQRQVIAEQLKDAIKKEMDEREVEELAVDEHIVRYRDVLTSIFDKTAFKKKYEELYGLYLRQVPSKKFSIS